MNEPWTCPICGAVMAPWMPNCVNCNGTQQKQANFGTGTPFPKYPITTSEGGEVK
jgi:hypothetical protein